MEWQTYRGRNSWRADQRTDHHNKYQVHPCPGLPQKLFEGGNIAERSKYQHNGLGVKLALHPSHMYQYSGQSGQLPQEHQHHWAGDHHHRGTSNGSVQINGHIMHWHSAPIQRWRSYLVLQKPSEHQIQTNHAQHPNKNWMEQKGISGQRWQRNTASRIQ